MTFKFSPCCSSVEPCLAPGVVTMSFEGFAALQKIPRCALTFRNNFATALGLNFGTGHAEGWAFGVNNEDAFGPIGGGFLADPGAFYAILGRVEPSIPRATFPVNGGAEFAITLQNQTTNQGVDFWEVASATFTGDSPAGYPNGFLLNFEKSPEDTCLFRPDVRIVSVRGQPTLTAVVVDDVPFSCQRKFGPVGKNAEFALSYTQNNFGTLATWRVTGVTVVNGGTGYRTGQRLRFNLGKFDQGLTSSTNFLVTADDGVITAVTGSHNSNYFKFGVLTGLVIDYRGVYYKESRDVSPYVAIPESAVFTSSLSDPLAGFTEEFSATVDSNIDSPTFGQITSINLVQSNGDRSIFNSTSQPSLEDPASNFVSSFFARCIHLLNGISFPTAKFFDGESVCIASCFGTGGAAVVDAADGYDFLPAPIASARITAPGSGYAVRGRQEPAATFSTAVGTGATFTAVFSERLDNCQRPFWELARVDVSESGGTGYGENSVLTMAVAGTTNQAASLRLFRKRLEPLENSVTVSVVNCPGAGSGSGATFKVNLKPNGTVPATWGVSSVEILTPGSGYESNFLLSTTEINTDNGGNRLQALARVGADGRIASVSVKSKGTYFRATTQAGSVNILTKGRFWQESNDLPPLVSNITATHGSDAVFSVAVNTDTSDANFGRLSGISILSSGSDVSLGAGFIRSTTITNICASRPTFLQNYQAFPVISLSMIRNRLGACELSGSFGLFGGGAESTFIFLSGATEGDRTFTLDNQTVTLVDRTGLNPGSLTVTWGGAADNDAIPCSCCELSGGCEESPLP